MSQLFWPYDFRLSVTQLVIQNIKTDNELLFAFYLEEELKERIEPLNNFLVLIDLGLKNFEKYWVQKGSNYFLVIVVSKFIILNALIWYFWCPFQAIGMNKPFGQQNVYELNPFQQTIFWKHVHIYDIHWNLHLFQFKHNLAQPYFLSVFWNFNAKVFQKFQQGFRFTQVLMKSILLFHMRHETSDPKVQKFGMLNLMLLSFALCACSSWNRRCSSHQRHRNHARNRFCWYWHTSCCLC